MKSRWMLAAACLALASGLASAQVFTAGPGLGLAVPDDAYNGTQGSMRCHAIAVPSGGGGGDLVNEVTVQIRLTHTWVGDLTIKLFGPGATATLLSRPGMEEVGDDGSTVAGAGENSNLLAANPLTYEMAAITEAEIMGLAPVDLTDDQTVCIDGGTPCNYNPTAGSSLSSDDLRTAFDGTTKVGNWQLCIGDGQDQDVGTLDGWTLTITSVPASAQVFTAGPGLGLVVPDSAYDGTQSSMLCHTIAVPSGGGDEVTEVTVQIRLTHTFVGDLTIKLFGPGATATLVSRPGLAELNDDGSIVGGTQSNLLAAHPLTYEMAATTEAESMGRTPVLLTANQTVCLDGGTPCNYNPSAGSSLSSDDLQTAFDGTTKVGNWQLCIGDAAAGDVGILDGWTLSIESVPVELLSFTVED